MQKTQCTIYVKKIVFIGLLSFTIQSCSQHNELSLPQINQENPSPPELGNASSSTDLEEPVESESTSEIKATTRISPYSDPIVLSSCKDVAPDIFIIDDISDLTALNDSTYRIFCVRPGDYRSFGHIKITQSGSKDAPREIRLYDEDLSDELPIALIPDSKRAIFHSIEFKEVTNWTVDRISIKDTPANTRAIWLREKSKNITLNRINVDNMGLGIHIDHGSDNALIQNSLIGNQKTQYDYVCIVLQGNSTSTVIIKNVRIIGNEIFNCNDGIQTVYDLKKSNYVDFEGLSIVDNDIYITNAIYTNGFGTLSATGNYACAENAIDLKVGTKNAVNHVKIYNNRMWGYRPTDENCGGGSGRDDIGSAIAVHYLAENILIKNNIFFDSGRGVGIATRENEDIGDLVRFIELSGNVFHGFDRKLFLDNRELGIALTVSGKRTSEINVNNNLFIDTSNWSTNGGSSHNTYKCNILINAGQEKWWRDYNNVEVTNNYYFNTLIHRDEINAIFFDDVDEALHGDLCFDTKRQSSPTVVCLNHAKPNPTSPHSCAINVDDLAS